jgi:hypothetical protein
LKPGLPHPLLEGPAGAGPSRYGIHLACTGVLRSVDDERLSGRDRADLARLADGTLPPRRQARVEARVAASPSLGTLLTEQRRALALVRGAAVEAPAGLRARLDAARRAAAPRARRWRVALAGGAAAAATATALALVLTLPGDVGAGPTVAQAAQLAHRPPQFPAPGVTDGRLALAVDGVAFPNWSYRFRWNAVGRRTDVVAGRRIVTVFYARRHWRLGYAIVAGGRLAPPVAAGRAQVSRTLLRHFYAAGANVVTWVRGGHTCVLTGRGVSTGLMLRLAAWRYPHPRL